MAVRKRYKAFTLLESVISMAIIVTVFTIFASTISNIATADTGYAHTTVLFQINRLSDEAKTEKLYIDEEKIIEGITYSKTFKKYEGSENAIQLSIIAKTEKDSTFFEYNELILKEHD